MDNPLITSASLSSPFQVKNELSISVYATLNICQEAYPYFTSSAWGKFLLFKFKLTGGRVTIIKPKVLHLCWLAFIMLCNSSIHVILLSSAKVTVSAIHVIGTSEV